MGRKTPSASHPPAAPRRVLQLVSGGWDSSLMWWVAGRPNAMYCGLPTGEGNLGEVIAVRQLARLCPEFGAKLTMLPFDFRPFKRPDEHHFPRESIMAQLAWAQGATVAQFGFVQEDRMTAPWVRKVTRRIAGAVGMPGFTVEFPAWKYTKLQLLRAALKAGMPMQFAMATHSCLTRYDAHCGKCENCIHRFSALAAQAVAVA